VIRGLRDRLRAKRGGGRERDASGLADEGLDRVPDPAPSRDAILESEEACGRLLGILGDERLQTIAMNKLAGQTNDLIAATLGCSSATVERRLSTIRDLWSEHAPGGHGRRALSYRRVEKE
jgi:DNA-directed RNA polymerase specialized sigma24 family protein